MSLVVAIIGGLLALVLFFMGWATVFFAADKIAPDNGAPAYKWIIFWGVYRGGMLGYPIVVAALVATAAHKFGV